jgi:hypothetical protein
MNLAEALAELGVEPGATDDEARRAYLRFVKTRRPESDPEGFMRLREAYEVIKAGFSSVSVEPLHAEPPSTPPTSEAPPDDEASDAPDAEEVGDEAPSEEEVQRLLREGDKEEAAYELARLYELAEGGINPHAPPLDVTVRLILELLEQGSLEPAATLEACARAWIKSSGDELRLLPGQRALAFRMVRELCKLPRRFPKKLRRAIARGIRTGTWRARTALSPPSRSAGPTSPSMPPCGCNGGRHSSPGSSPRSSTRPRRYASPESGCPRRASSASP